MKSWILLLPLILFVSACLCSGDRPKVHSFEYQLIEDVLLLLAFKRQFANNHNLKTEYALEHATHFILSLYYLPRHSHRNKTLYFDIELYPDSWLAKCLHHYKYDFIEAYLSHMLSYNIICNSIVNNINYISIQYDYSNLLDALTILHKLYQLPEIRHIHLPAYMVFD